MNNLDYYLVSKETGKIHCHFKINPKFLQERDTQFCLSGRLYYSRPESAFTLTEINSIDYSSNYFGIDSDESYRIFEFISEVHYVSYKNYRVYNFSDQLQFSGDFAGNDFMELNAFLATLFKEFIKPEQVEEWSNTFNSFDDKYSVNDLIMQYFTIESDSNEGVYLDSSLRDDHYWKGFEKP